MTTFLMWVSACRPRTLLLTLSPILVGSAMVWQQGQWSWGWVGLVLLTATLLQIGANLANDYFDGINGKDSPQRVGPTRLTGSGLATPNQVKAAMWGVLGGAVLLGVALMIRGGWPIVLVGMAAVLAALGYSGGRRPYGYWGGADGVVWLFFGPVACQGTVWVMTHTLMMDAWVLGSAQGLVATAVLVVNYIRDEAEDRRTGKRTLVVRFGSRWGHWQYRACVSGAALITLGWGLWSGQGGLMGVGLVLLPVSLVLGRRIAQPSAVLTVLLAQTARFGLALALGCWFSMVTQSIVAGGNPIVPLLKGMQ